MKTITRNQFKLITVFGLLFIVSFAFSQATIKSQGFDSATSDNLGYTVSNATNVITSSTAKVSNPNSLRFTGVSNSNENALFDAIDISGYTNVTASIAFASTGVDTDEDLFVDFSYDNGVTFTTSIKLIDGNNGGSGQNLNYGNGDSAPGQTTNPYTFNIPNGNTSLRIRVRSVNLDTSEFFYIDNVIVRGTAIPEINLQGNGIDIASGSTTISSTINTDFGTVNVLSDTVTSTYTIQNSGIATLNIWSVYSNNSEFTASTSSTTIAPGATATLTVVFDPNTGGTRNGIISISNSDSNESTYTFAVQGIGNGQEINVSANGNTILSGNTAIAVSDNTDFGTDSGTKTYTIENLGGNTLSIYSVYTNSGEFNASVSTTSIAPGGTATLTVTYVKSLAGTRTATISISNDDANEATYSFNVQAIIADKEINLQANGNDIASGSTTISSTINTDFSNLDISAGSISKTYSIQNTGGINLNIWSVFTNLPEFTASVAPSTIAPGATATLTVSWDPYAIGTRNGIITISNDDSNESTYTFAVQGIGTSPAPSNKTISVVTSTLCSGTATNITVASSLASETYQLRNNSDNSLIGTAVTGNGGTINLPTGNLSSSTTFNVLAKITATGSTAQMSITPTVTVLTTPNNQTVSGTALICSGSSTNITLAASESTSTYQLRNNSGNTNIGSSVVGNGGTLNLPTGNLVSNTTFNVLATNTTTGCSTQMAITPTVTLNPLPANKTVGVVASTVCSGSGTNITVISSLTNTTYQLRNNSDNSLIGSAITGNGALTLNLPTGNLTSPTTFNVLATIISSGCSAQMITTQTVNITPTPIGGSVSGGTTICSGDTSDVLTLSGYSGSIQRWESSISPYTTWNNIANTNPTYTSGALAQTTQFRARISNGTCPTTTSSTTTVTVLAAPVNRTVAAVASTICSGKATTITVASSIATTTYQLRNNADNSLIGTAVTGTGGTINLPTGNLTSTTTFNVLATIISTGCTAVMTTKPTVTVNICYPEISVVGNGTDIIDEDTLPSTTKNTDFGSVSIINETYTATYTIKNTGVGDLVLGAITFTGADASNFAILNAPDTVIPPGSSTTFDVIFDPSTVGIKNTTINIVTNDVDESNYNFDIVGLATFIDTDGDNVANNVDIDDDNDGILDSTENGTCATDPFVNGNFETTLPLLPATSYIITPDANVPGWQSTEGKIEIWSTGFNGVPSALGNQFAELNANVPGTLYQTFCLNGASGTVKWSIKHRGRSGVDQAFVKFGKTLADAQASTPIVTMVDGNTAWGTYSGVYTIPYGQTQIVLTFQSGYTASGSPSIGNFIDDVQITITQQSVDTDQDGIVNIVDLDDDNDGVSDIEEGGFKMYSNNTSTMDKTNPSLWVDANGNGMNDYIDTKIANGTYTIPNFDSDGLPDYIDLDSDNDTLFDVDEAGLFNGDGDINGDGKGDGMDADGDGILDLYDNSLVYGTTFRAYAQDSDANGTPNYKQLDSNSDGINDIKTGLYGSTDANNDGKIDGLGDVDKDGITDTFDTNTSSWGSPRDLNRKMYLDFDGRNDYAQGESVLDGLTEATLMAFIDLNSAFSGTGVILGQTNFQIRVNSSKKLQVIVNGTTLTYNTEALNTAQWTHVGAIYGNGLLKLYINGKMVNSTSLSGAIIDDGSLLTIGKNPTSNSNYFKGKIDEVRIFNIALNDEQLQRMVYQEIQENAGEVRGAIIPRNIGSLPFTNLLRYYRMDVYKDDVIDDLTTPSIDTVTGMEIFNHKVIDSQEAPLPFTTSKVGDFETAVDNPSRDIRGLDVIEYDYSIILVNHNINETSNASDIGLVVAPGVTVTMNNDTKLLNDWYLKLDGKIDLQGKSQLVQTIFSELDATSAGSIERDQQGQTSLYNYNYWSSPVGEINATSNNNSYTVASIMKDGTNPSDIKDITWVKVNNGAPTSPITLSSNWIYKFQNTTPIYANWAQVRENGILLPGQGYTMKGCGGASATQNYTFVGKPNNGAISLPIAANNLNLCGNPYPSAIDSEAFLLDNLSSTTGAVYFWEHYTTNNTHVTRDYQGGYATRNLIGGTPPVSPAGISGLGTSTRVPSRYIPVGQGFLVYGSATGGNIVFGNNQRGFVKENNAQSNVMFKQKPTTSAKLNNNSEDVIIENKYKKIRLGFNSANNYHRQVLMGFMDELATSGIDNGFDAPNIDKQPNDMYFINNGTNLIIQGESYFNTKNSYPIGLKTNLEGKVSFTLDGLENFEKNQEVFIYDNETAQYHNISNDIFEINLPKGTFDNRFSLRFANSNNALSVNNQELNDNIWVAFTTNNKTIMVKNNLLNTTVNSIMVFNMLGQTISSWDVKNENQSDIQIPVKNLSTGTYIIKVTTTNGDLNKKVIVK